VEGILFFQLLSKNSTLKKNLPMNRDAAPNAGKHGNNSREAVSTDLLNPNGKCLTLPAQPAELKPKCLSVPAEIDLFTAGTVIQETANISKKTPLPKGKGVFLL
jgi:hypothetical protein